MPVSLNVASAKFTLGHGLQAKELFSAPFSLSLVRLASIE